MLSMTVPLLVEGKQLTSFGVNSVVCNSASYCLLIEAKCGLARCLLALIMLCGIVEHKIGAHIPFITNTSAA